MHYLQQKIGRHYEQRRKDPQKTGIRIRRDAKDGRKE